MRKHFHYGSQYRKEVAEVTREGVSSTFSSWHINTTRDERVHGTFLPPLADWTYIYYFHYESYIDKPRNWWQMTFESWRTVTHFFAGHSDTLTESLIQPDIKAESSSRRTLISAPTVITPAKKIETVRGFVGLNISCLNIRRYLTLSDFHYQTHTTLNLKMCNKTDLNVKNCLFSKNNCRNIWIIQIKVVTLHHQNNNSNNN